MIIISLGSILAAFVIWFILKSAIGTISENIGNWVDKTTQKESNRKINIPQNNTVKLSEEVLPTKESKLREEQRREEIKRKWHEEHKI